MTENKKLENIKIEGGENTPEIDFDFQTNIYKVSGMSYMEDVRAFYDATLEKLELHLSELKDQDVKFLFDLSYFNSSSSRVVFCLFETLDKTAMAGNDVSIEWHFDDEDIAEEGEELAEDIEKAEFILVEKDA